MPRIIQLAPDGGGRYIAVDRDGELWRGETMRQKDGGQEYIHHEVHGEPMDYFGYPICEVYIQRWVLTEVCR